MTSKYQMLLDASRPGILPKFWGWRRSVNFDHYVHGSVSVTWASPKAKAHGYGQKTFDSKRTLDPANGYYEVGYVSEAEIPYFTALVRAMYNKGTVSEKRPDTWDDSVTREIASALQTRAGPYLAEAQARWTTTPVSPPQPAAPAPVFFGADWEDDWQRLAA